MANDRDIALEDAVLVKVRRHVRILVDLGRIGGESGDFQHFLNQVVLQVARAVEIDHVKVLEYRPKTSDLLIVAGIGWREGVVGSTTLPSDLHSPPGRSFQTGQPVVVDDFSQQNELNISPVLREHAIVSLANVPILVDGSAWGVLEVDSTVTRDFSRDTIEFLMAAASLIGVLLERKVGRSDTVLLRAAMEAQNQDVLLREMQHRVKNNFQIIMSSIALQKRRYTHVEVHRVLEDLTSRISAIALAHDQLSLRDGGKVVALADYVRALCRSIEQQVDGVAMEIEADEVELSIDRAVSLGLILNELATNSIKHAFGTDGGCINVKLVAGVGYGEGRLTVSDNGQGVAKGHEGGSGLKLIESLARQMGASFTQESSNKGTTGVLTFPLISR